MLQCDLTRRFLHADSGSNRGIISLAFLERIMSCLITEMMRIIKDDCYRYMEVQVCLFGSSVG